METTRQTRPPISSPITIDAPLSPQWGFVVQFRAVPGGAVYPAGRVEHLVSGRTTHFQSLEELTALLEKELHVSKGV
jgi:hypothetical protein